MLTTGADNKVFADSNIVCHRRLEAIVPGRHELKVYPGYGHQDVFMGKDVARDIFPSMLDFLRRNSKPSQTLAMPVPIVGEQPVA
jgi:cholesterol oxidase